MFSTKLLKFPFSPKLRLHLRPLTVLGIETSCDDTGCAIVTDKGQVLGDSLRSQELIHLRNGGIIPPIARDLHQESIEHVVNDALAKSGLNFGEIDAIAATVKPGLALSLLVGARYGQNLAKVHNKPFIGIHHMEAHALAVRMNRQVDFPFLVFLVSGGHCLLAVVKDVDKFVLLGEGRDDAPGEAFDKVARRMKLTNIAEYRKMSGGEAIEKAARASGNAAAFQFPPALMQYRDCSFSFSGYKALANRFISQEEEKFNVGADQVIPNYRDIAASFQYAVARHLGHRLQRAMEFIQLKEMIPEDHRCLVIAGGVACNKYLAEMMKIICNAYGYQLAVPPAKLCTDNGLMIAWNGVERLQRNLGIVPAEKALTIDVEAKCRLGEDNRQHVLEADLKCKWVQLPQN